MIDPNPTIREAPANEASWADLEAILGRAKCHAHLCFCQRFKMGEAGWRSNPDEERAHRLRTQTDCQHPDSGGTTGLVAYVDGEPAGRCSIEPRASYPYLPGARGHGARGIFDDHRARRRDHLG